MIIYEFSTWGTKRDELFAIEEIEVEEKPKTYVGRGCRINKEDIGKLQSSFGNKMYLLDNNPQPYIQAMKERLANTVKVYETRVAEAKRNLAEWEALAGQAARECPECRYFVGCEKAVWSGPCKEYTEKESTKTEEGVNENGNT